MKKVFLPPKRAKSFSAQVVRKFITRENGKTSLKELDSLKKNEWLASHLAKETSISAVTLRSWAKRGWAHGRKLWGIKGQIVIWADKEEIQRLKKLITLPAKKRSHPA